MGADLLLNTVVLDDKLDPDWKAAQVAIREEMVGRYTEDLGPEGEEELERHLRMLGEFREAWHTLDRRDVEVRTIRGARILMTGGMSWGDSPTELFDVINDLREVGALKAAGFEDE